MQDAKSLLLNTKDSGAVDEEPAMLESWPRLGCPGRGPSVPGEGGGELVTDCHESKRLSAWLERVGAWEAGCVLCVVCVWKSW